MIGIVDFGMGNIGSIENMFRKIGVPAAISSDPAVLADADRLVLPGVGSFDRGMRNLEERGLVPVLRRHAFERKAPVLGICLGMQLFSRDSEEGTVPGLGWLDARTIKFRADGEDWSRKFPHMGWNELQLKRSHPIFDGFEDKARFYFVHSFHVEPGTPEIEVARTDYGRSFVSAVASENIVGVQFHPEKSHRFGMALLSNFAKWG